jgi:endonuclease G, mitochondrial
MKKVFVTLAIIFTLGIIINAQIKVDKGIYKLNFSNTLRQPTYVSYFLYKGGGDCDRDEKHFTFKNDEPNLKCATDKDYEGSKYDKGHLANAEDFASDCTKEELTFRYYNCLPQTTNLNRGIWKKIETKVREWSQKERLYIICGGFFSNKKIGEASVPSYCWKVVQSVKTKKVLFCGWFSNTAKAVLDTLTVPILESKLKSHLLLCK